MKSEWKKYRLGELYEVHNGLSKGRKFFGRGYPFLSFSTVFNRFFLPEKLTDLVESTEKERETLSIHRGDVFITRTSETYDELGMSCVALKDYPNATFNGFTKRLRPIEEGRVLPEYIGYFLRSPQFRKKFEQIANVTTRASLSNGDLLNMEVSLPPLPVQRKIASILSALDDKIETNNAICRNLEEQIKLIFKDTYASKVKASSARIEDVTLADVCSAITKGTTPSTLGHRFENVGVNFVKAESITNCHRIEKNKISFISLETHNKLKRSQVEDGDILFSIAGTLGRFTLADTHILPANSNQAVAIIRANKEKVAPEYLYSLFIAGWHEEYCKKNVQQAVQANLSLGIIKSLPIFLLLGQEMKNYLSKITPLIMTMKKLERESSSLAYLRDALLPKLMSGELEVETLV